MKYGSGVVMYEEFNISNSEKIISTKINENINICTFILILRDVKKQPD